VRDSEGQEGQGHRPDLPLPPSLTPGLEAALAAGPTHPVALLLGRKGGIGLLLDRVALLAEDDRASILAAIPQGMFASRIEAMRGAMD